MSPQELNQLLGNIDLYLLDHILKGRFHPEMRLLDVGCGEGRNLVYFIRQGYEVWGIDKDPAALRLLRMYGRSLHPDFDPERFIEDDAADISLPPDSFDGVISSAVLHFADSHEHFQRMFAELVRVLRPNGLLFIRTAMLAGIQEKCVAIDHYGKYLLPDGSQRYLLRTDMLNSLCQQHKLNWVEPLKHVVVQNARSMGSILLQKIDKS